MINMTTVESFAAAYYIASRAHEGQLDKAGQDYFNHPWRVSEKFNDYALKTIAILHDVLEDTWVTEDILRKLFSEEVCDAIVALTRNEDESYGDFIKRVSKNFLASKVKIADLEDNMDLSRLKEITDEDLKRTQKYCKWRNYLLEAISKEALAF